MMRHMLLGMVLTLSCGVAVLPSHAGDAGETVRLVFTEAESAGISGFREFWNQPLPLDENGPAEMVSHGLYGSAPSAVWNAERPGAMVFDALHRQMLVRFPGSADAIAAKLSEGYRVSKVELILPYRHTEMFPFGYVPLSGMSFLGDMWVRKPPRWHAVAWALRRPWTADWDIGPTFNAYIHSAGYWGRFGAQDQESDRFPMRFGPVEVSYREATAYKKIDTEEESAEDDAPAIGGVDGDATDGLDDLFDTMVDEVENPAQPARMDITAMLTDTAFGETLGERLRSLEECGLVLSKWELYDLRYKHPWSGYEWGTTTGGRGIMVRKPSLEVTLERVADAGNAGGAPVAVEGAPTAVVPAPDEFERLKQTHGAAQPKWMPDWQWQRVQELMRLERTPGLCEFPETYDGYLAWLDDLLSWTPRHFIGHRTPRRAGLIIRHRDAMPEPVYRHTQRYWEGWLMPDSREPTTGAATPAITAPATRET